jgi:hypothetical protein
VVLFAEDLVMPLGGVGPTRRERAGQAKGTPLAGQSIGIFVGHGGVDGIADDGGDRRVPAASLASEALHLRFGQRYLGSYHGWHDISPPLDDVRALLFGRGIIRNAPYRSCRSTTKAGWRSSRYPRPNGLRSTYVKHILRKYGYPPDKQEKATDLVSEQAEVLSEHWVAA